MPLDKFDLVVCPDHDEIQGSNVIKTTGAIHYLTDKEISREKILYKLIEKIKKLLHLF